MTCTLINTLFERENHDRESRMATTLNKSENKIRKNYEKNLKKMEKSLLRMTLTHIDPKAGETKTKYNFVVVNKANNEEIENSTLTLNLQDDLSKDFIIKRMDDLSDSFKGTVKRSRDQKDDNPKKKMQVR